MPAQKFLQLKDYFLKELRVRYVGSPGEQSPSELNFRFDRKALPDGDCEFTMGLRMSPKAEVEGEVSGYDVETVITGIFHLPEETPPEVARDLVEINGAIILYGLLRGFLATATGMFPAQQRFLLPTVNFAEVIRSYREQDATPKKSRKKAAAKRKPKTDKPEKN